MREKCGQLSEDWYNEIVNWTERKKKSEVKNLQLVVELLGTPRVLKDGKEVIFPYRKVEGFFYYLCVKQTVLRDEAIGVLWADCEENAARKNLRDALYHLKKLLSEDIIAAEGNNRICLQMDQIAAIDYLELTEENLLQSYNGEFLRYFYIKNCIEFEDWTEEIRNDLMCRYESTARKQIEAAALSGRTKLLVARGEDLIRGKICEEALYQQILSSLLRSGHGAEARQLYQRFCAMLEKEYGAEPEDKTRALIEDAASFEFARQTEPDSNGDKRDFFCREREMLEVLNNLHSFHQGEPAVSLLLTGEAGVGKSTILHKLTETLKKEEYVVLVYQCVQTEAELYLKPWNDLLAQVQEYGKSICITESAAPDFYGQMDTVIFATQYELYIKSTLDKLSRNVGNKKIVIVIDDVQWMDHASKRLLSNLIFWSQNQKILIVLAGREETSAEMTQFKVPLNAKGLLREITVPRFTLEETKEIIAACQPDLIAQENMLDEIYRSTAGNALFLLEFLKEIEHGGSASQLSEKTTGIIQSRLLAVPEQDRNLLDNISLYPRLATLEDILILDERPRAQIIESLERLLSCQLIRPSSTYNKNGYGFAHQLIREYIYNGMLEDKRKMLHGLVAESYEKKFIATEDERLYPMLIYHFNFSGNVYKTYTYQLEYLRDFYAVQHEIYPTVLTSKQEMDIPIRQLDGSDGLVALAEKIRALNQKEAGVDLLRMKLEFLIGRYDLFSGSFERGLSNIKVSIAIARKRNDGQYLMENDLQMIFHAIQIHNLKMFDEYITACEELLTQYDYSEADICTVLRLRGLYYLKNYRYAEAEKIFQEVIARLEPLCRQETSYRIGLAACYNYLGESRQAVGKLEEALGYFLKAIECSKKELTFSGLGVFYCNAGYIFYCQGNLDEAENYVDQGNRCLEERGALWGRAKAAGYKALIAIQRENWEAAEAYYRAAYEFAQRGGNPTALSLVREIEYRLKTTRSG